MNGDAARVNHWTRQDAAVSAGYGSAGERPMAISVIVAVGPVADDLVNQIADRTRAQPGGVRLGFPQNI
ncbi:hypothetical protein [Spirillospora sp. NPDC048819]|uniref:hypothetical protein n=1 Tax=Spirillospora sp. NPDC048819 TaxID=3155268 RepID=UPI0033F2DF75